MFAANKSSQDVEMSENNLGCIHSSLISKECVTLILSSFVEEILIPLYSKPIQLFVLPCLANSAEFPFPHLLQYLSDLIAVEAANQIITDSAQQNEAYIISSDTPTSTSVAQRHLRAIENVHNSSFVFHSFLTLDLLHMERIKHNPHLLRNYINVLGNLSENIRKLQQRSSHSLFKQYDMEIEAEDDIDSDEEDNHKSESISPTERDCLIEAITLLNDQQRVELILDQIDNYLDDVQVLDSLCKICHNLMLYHRSAVSEFRLLYMLTFRPKFIRALWFTLHTQQNSAGFSSPLNLITKGIQIGRLLHTIWPLISAVWIFFFNRFEIFQRTMKSTV